MWFCSAITPCGLLGSYQRFGETLEDGVALSSERIVTFLSAHTCRDPEGKDLHFHLLENVKFIKFVTKQTLFLTSNELTVQKDDTKVTL
jgi:hypothetical protein